jgi:hypothetical protein
MTMIGAKKSPAGGLRSGFKPRLQNEFPNYVWGGDFFLPASSLALRSIPPRPF